MKRLLLAVVPLAALLLALALGYNAWRAGTPPALPEAPAEPAPALDAEAALARFAGALRFPTVSDRDPARIDAAAFEGFREHLRASYPRSFSAFEWELVNGHGLLGRWAAPQGSAAAPAMFIAHYDVVPVDPADAGAWSAAPFGGERRDGYVWGRGTLDDKLNVTALLEATEALIAAGWTPGRDLYFGFGHDEEVGGALGAGGIAERLAQRGVRPAFVVDEGGAIALPGMVPGLDRPAAMVGIAEKGYLSVELVARARGGHSSVPRQDSAILGLVRAIDTLDRHPFPRSFDFVHGMAQAIAPGLGFGGRVVAANTWLFGPLAAPWLHRVPELDALTRVTVAPTLLSAGVKDNVQPTEARATLNLRLMPGWTVEATLARLRSLLDGQPVELRVLQGNEASRAASSRTGEGWVALSGALQAAWREQPGGAQAGALPVVPYLVMAGTDLKHYEPIAGDTYRFSFVPMSAEDFRRVHGIDERISEQAYLGNVRFYWHLLRAAGAMAGPSRSNPDA